MAFDIAGARKEGYSDAEIITHLTSNRKFDVAGARKEGYSDTEIADHLAGIGQEQTKGRPLSTPAQEMQSYIEGMSGPEQFFVGMGKGMTDVYTGGKQRLAELGQYAGVVSPETVQGIRQQVERDREIFKPLADQSFLARAGKFTGETAPTAVIPGGVAGGFLRRGLTAAGAGALTGALQPTGGYESAMGNIALGAATGGVMSGVMSAGGKVVNAILGKVPVNEVSQLAGKHNIPVTLGEITGNPHVQHAETLLEKVPLIGLGKFRKEQREASEQAAKGFLSKYIIDPDHPEIMSANREYVDTLYKGIAAKIGDTPQQINPANTQKVAKDLLDRYPDIFKQFQDTKMEKTLRDVIKGTRSVTAPSPSAYIGDELTMSIPSRLTFDEAWTLRKGLGEMIGQSRKKLARGEVNETQHGQMKALFKAIDDDMENWGNKIDKPEVMQTFKAANESYRNYVVKYDIIQRAYDKAAGVVGAGEMFSPKKFSTALKNLIYKDKAFKTFSPQEISEMTGIANIMQVVKRGGQYMENPPTGARYGMPALASVAGMAATLKTLPFIAFGRFLSGNEKGKALVLAASKIEPSSPAMGKLIDSLYNMVPKATTTLATEE